MTEVLNLTLEAQLACVLLGGCFYSKNDICFLQAYKSFNEKSFFYTDGYYITVNCGAIKLALSLLCSAMALELKMSCLLLA